MKNNLWYDADNNLWFAPNLIEAYYYTIIYPKLDGSVDSPLHFENWCDEIEKQNRGNE